MYGHYRISIDLDESIAEINLLLSAMKDHVFDPAITRSACAHYKQLALVCACAFMMSPLAMSLKDSRKHIQVKKSMADSVDAVYPIFASNSQFWGYQETVMVVTELALSFVQTVLAFCPSLKYALGLPQMYVFTPTHVGYAEAPDESKFHAMSRVERYRELKALDDLNLNPRANLPELENRLTFTLWVRPAPSAKLLT